MVGRRRLTVVRALLWEQWRQTRLVLLLPLVVAVAGTVASYLPVLLVPLADALFGYAARTSLHRLAVGFSELCIPISLILYFCAALIVPFAHCEANNLQAALPQRLCALPVRRWLLAVLCVAYRTISFGFVGAGLIGLRYLTKDFGPETQETAIIADIVIFLFFLHAQACLWTLGFIHVGAAGVAAVGLFGPLLLCYSILLLKSPLATAGPIARYAPLMAVWVLAPIIGSILERRGFWMVIRSYLGAEFPTLGRRRAAFASLSEAQRWFEWRRRGLLFPIATACFMVPILTILTYVAYLKFLHPSQISLAVESYFVVSFWCTTLASIVSGLLMTSLESRDLVTGFAAFTMTRCISTRDMALDRMRVTARSVAMTYGTILVVALPWVALTSSFGEFDAMVHEIAGPGVKAYGLLGLAVVGCATLNWAVISFLGPLLAIAGVVWTFAMAFMTEEYVGALLLGLSVVLLLSLLVWAFHAAKRRRMPGPFADGRTPWVYLALCGCLYALFFLLIRVTSMPEADTSDVALGIGLWCLASLACLAPLFVMPVWVHWLRHR